MSQHIASSSIRSPLWSAVSSDLFCVGGSPQISLSPPWLFLDSTVDRWVQANAYCLQMVFVLTHLFWRISYTGVCLSPCLRWLNFPTQSLPPTQKTEARERLGEKYQDMKTTKWLFSFTSQTTNCHLATFSACDKDTADRGPFSFSEPPLLFSLILKLLELLVINKWSVFSCKFMSHF